MYYFYAYRSTEIPYDTEPYDTQEEWIEMSTQDRIQARRWETYYMIQNYHTAITREPTDPTELWISDQAGVLW